MIKALLCIGEMCRKAVNDDNSGSKEVKERRSRASSTIYTVDTTQKTSVNGQAVNYSCADQSPLSTLNITGRSRSSVAAAWRYCSAGRQADVRGRASPYHADTVNNRPASNNECLRRSETSSEAEVFIRCDYLSLIHI